MFDLLHKHKTLTQTILAVVTLPFAFFGIYNYFGRGDSGKPVASVGGNKIEQRYVTLGTDYGSLVAVSKGVSDGESVAVGNLLKLGPGMVVKPVPAPPAAKTGAGQSSGG